MGQVCTKHEQFYEIECPYCETAAPVAGYETLATTHALQDPAIPVARTIWELPGVMAKAHAAGTPVRYTREVGRLLGHDEYPNDGHGAFE